MKILMSEVLPGMVIKTADSTWLILSITNSVDDDSQRNCNQYMMPNTMSFLDVVNAEHGAFICGFNPLDKVKLVMGIDKINYIRKIEMVIRKEIQERQECLDMLDLIKSMDVSHTSNE